MKYYYTQKQLAEYLGCGKELIRRRVDGMRRQVELGRYDPILMSDRFINIVAFMDYNTYHEALDDPILKRGVPKFDYRKSVINFYEPSLERDIEINIAEVVKETIKQVFSGVFSQGVR